MLFIDGDHTFEGVVLDFFQYAPLINPDSPIVLQDIRDHHRPDVGVHRLWDAIKRSWPDRCEEFMSGDDAWGGIGILWNPKWDGTMVISDPEIARVFPHQEVSFDVV